jgi:hypothetical protein
MLYSNLSRVCATVNVDASEANRAEDYASRSRLQCYRVTYS